MWGVCVILQEKDRIFPLHYTITTKHTNYTQHNPVWERENQAPHRLTAALSKLLYQTQAALSKLLLFPGDLEKENIDASFIHKYAVTLA